MPKCVQSELTGGIFPGIMSHYTSFKMQIAAADAQAVIWASPSALKCKLFAVCSTLPDRLYDEHTLTRPDCIRLFQTLQTVGFN